MTVWRCVFSRHNSGGNQGSRSRCSWFGLHQCQLHQSESVQHYTRPFNCRLWKDSSNTQHSNNSHCLFTSKSAWLSLVAHPGPAHENHLLAVLRTESPSRAKLAFRKVRRRELRTSSRRTSEGKPEIFFLVKYDPVSIKSAVTVMLHNHQIYITQSWAIGGREAETETPFTPSQVAVTLKWSCGCYFNT